MKDEKQKTNFLSFMISDELSVVNVEDLLLMISCFSLADFKTLFVLSLNSLTDVSRYASL